MKASSCAACHTSTQYTGQRGVSNVAVLEFPLPQFPADYPPLIFPNSEGFVYQARGCVATVRR